jgi:hypothetical protein
VAQDGTDWDWAGALTAASFVDDVAFIRSFVEAYAKAMKKRK